MAHNWQTSIRQLTVAGMSALIVVSAAGCASPSEAEEPSAPSTVEVRYDLTSSTDKTEVGLKPWADVTYRTTTGTSQSEVSLPLLNKQNKTGLVNQFTPGTALYISGQKGDWDGDITCQIKVNDVVVSENTSSGKYGIASCSATA